MDLNPGQTDRLQQIFQQLISDVTRPQETHEEFIFRVVESYVLELIRENHIPIPYLDQIQKDLEDEVLEIYRKTTYGHYSLEDYRKAL